MVPPGLGTFRTLSANVCNWSIFQLLIGPRSAITEKCGESTGWGLVGEGTIPALVAVERKCKIDLG